MARTKLKIAALVVGVLSIVAVYELINTQSSPLAHERDLGIESNKEYAVGIGDDNLPKALLQLDEDQAFTLMQGEKHYLYRFKSFLKVTAVDYLVDKDGNIASKAIPTMMMADSRIFFEDTTMVQVNYCPTQFESFDEARRAVLEDKAVWINDLIRPPSAFKGDIKTIK